MHLWSSPARDIGDACWSAVVEIQSLATASPVAGETHRHVLQLENYRRYQCKVLMTSSIDLCSIVCTMSHTVATSPGSGSSEQKHRNMFFHGMFLILCCQIFGLRVVHGSGRLVLCALQYLMCANFITHFGVETPNLQAFLLLSTIIHHGNFDLFCSLVLSSCHLYLKLVC